MEKNRNRYLILFLVLFFITVICGMFLSSPPSDTEKREIPLPPDPDEDVNLNSTEKTGKVVLTNYISVANKIFIPVYF